MYGIPQQLYPYQTQKVFGDSSFMYGMPMKANVFYSIKDGNWNDINTWENVGNRVGVLPTATDDVYIRHVVTSNFANSSTTVNNLFISGKLNFANVRFANFIVSGNMQCTGTLDMSTSGAEINFILRGINNRIDNFITINAAVNAFIYGRAGDQPIMNLPYGNLQFIGSGKRIAQGDINCWALGYSTTGSIDFILDAWNLTVGAGGASFVTGNGTLQKTAGNILFIGFVNNPVNNFFSYQTGSAEIEFRNGLALNNFATVHASTTGVWKFTTNAQTVSAGAGNGSTGAVVFPNVIMAEGVNVIMQNPSGYFQINNAIDGTTGSNFINKGNLYFNTLTPAMQTAGSIDVTSFANTVGYVYAGNQNVPYGGYSGLLISNTGIKDLTQNTTLSGAATILNGANLQASTYNFSVGGVFLNQGGTFGKSGAGSLLFSGAITDNNSGGTMDFSGNPTVELRGGIASWNTVNFTSGTGAWNFTTNNQSLFFYNRTYVWNNPITITGAITVTLPFRADFVITQASGVNIQSPQGVQINSTLNGTVALSKFVNQGNIIFGNATPPMATGVFDITASTNYVCYNFNGNATLPFSSYQGLYINGTGIKTTPASLTVSSTLALNNGSNIELSTFNATLGRTAMLGLLSKSGAGNVIFTGTLWMGNGHNATSTIDFSAGNPNIEMQNGMQFINSTGKVSLGTGALSFTTNNQSFFSANTTSNDQIFLYNPVTVSGAIVFTIGLLGTNSALTIVNTINGNNAASTLDNRARINYQNAAQPMATGILQTNAAANTFTYNAAGAQAIKGGTYRTLTLAGSGVKTLQENTSVINTYTLTAPATKNNNGFTFGNP